MDIAAKLTYYRELKGYTVNKLANLSGVSQSHVREIQLGNRNPTVEMLELLCTALDITLAEFFSEETPEKLDQDRLQQLIYRLSPSQKEGLKVFLDSMVSEE